MKLFRGQIFDGVFSLGYNCRCAMYLRDARLRDCSSPFDWLTGSTFAQRIETLTTDFRGWLEEGNLDLVEVELPPGSLKEHDRYVDRTTGYEYLHDFDTGIPLAKTHPAVKAKYDRRIRRLFGRLESGGRYLFVWWSIEPETDASLLGALAKLRARFASSDLCILAIDNGGGDRVVYAEVGGSDGRVVRASARVVREQLDMTGNEKLGMSIFGCIRLRGGFGRKLHWALARFAIHAIIMFVPGKDRRRALKKRLESRLMKQYA